MEKFWRFPERLPLANSIQQLAKERETTFPEPQRQSGRSRYRERLADFKPTRTLIHLVSINRARLSHDRLGKPYLRGLNDSSFPTSGPCAPADCVAYRSRQRPAGTGKPRAVNLSAGRRLATCWTRPTSEGPGAGFCQLLKPKQVVPFPA